MSGSAIDLGLLEAAVSGDVAAAKARIDEGVDPNGADDRGWTPLTWSAGKGFDAMVELLLNSGAHPMAFTDDGRTPYLVAAAAGHKGVARRLAAAEEARGGDVERKSSRLHETQPYCRAYPIGQLRSFSGWSETELVPPSPLPSHMDEELFQPLTDEDLVYLHRSLCVTRSIFEDELIIFDGDVSGWADFCEDILAFQPMDDFDWIDAGSKAQASAQQEDRAESQA